LAVVVLGVGGLFTYLTGYVTTISGRRAVPGGPVEGSVTNRFLHIVPLGTTELPGLTAARLEVVPDKKNPAKPTFRVLFDTDAGPIPMTWFSRGGRADQEHLVEEINARLADAESDSFIVRHVGAGWFIVFPILVVVLTFGYLAAKIAMATARRNSHSTPSNAG
jgi:hypothetical protein